VRREGETVEQSSSEFAQTITDPSIVILDVRSPEEFHAGHIEGAINIDVNGIDFDSQVSALDHDIAYAVYCRSGVRSVTAMGLMMSLGFTSFFHLTDGILDWVATGHPVVS